MTRPVKRYLDLVSGAAKRAPSSTAVVFEDRQITFAELDDRVGRLGGALRSAGLVPGDRVALLAANELEYMEIQGACLRSGFTLVPLNTRLADPELAYIVGDAAPKVFIGGRGFDQRVARIAGDAGVKQVLGLGAPTAVDPYDQVLAAGEADPEADPLDPKLNTTFLYTSGTTGRPKGAMIDREGFTARVFVNALELEITSRDVWLQSLPMFHIAAFLGFAFVFRGSKTVMLPAFTPPEALRLMAEHRVSVLVLVPTMIGMVLDDPAVESFDASDLRLLIYGGAPIDSPLLRRAMERLDCGFHQQYGMTETGAQCILHPEDHDPDDAQALTSGGSAAVSFDVRVVDEEDRPLPTGEVGEIVCRGPAVMSGYWNLPEVTAETLRGGWHHTGDLGYFDERNLVHVVDRRNDMIISGGENVYPREVEAVLAEHPAVPDVAVIGLPDERWGQLVVAVVAEGAPPDAELEAFLRERIAGYKVPRRWIRLPELPRNVTGKVLKAQLRADLS
ncbi:MAG: class I adenylate-forming enzyme family protein [Acidimicrobiia bacterium]